jgi:alpha-galactosidase
MVTIPRFVLRKLYVKGSLRNTDEGCSFDLKNIVDGGTVTQLAELEVDSTPYPSARLRIHTPEGSVLSGDQITPDAPLILPQGVRVGLRLPGVALSPGRHHLCLRFQTQEMGELAFDVSDEVPAGQVSGETPPGEFAVPAAIETTGPSQELGRGIRDLKIAILGAGSAVFARQLVTDVLCTPGLEGGTFALVDIDAGRLELAHRITEKLVARSGRGWMVESSTERRDLLPGCDYVISLIEVAGLQHVRHDYEIPLKYGVDQCIGDTSGPGGIFKMLRTGQAWLEIAKDVERLCPQAVVMNYSNPMSALTLLALQATDLQVVGLCHSVQGTSRQLATYLDVPREELRYRCAGINHMAWFVELTHRGEDLYPRLREVAQDPEIYECDPVRFEMMLHFGAFVTESSGHFSEYLPYFRKRPDLLEKYTREGYRGESGFYANNWPRWRAEADEAIRAQVAGRSEIILQRSEEYASYIVEACESGRPAVFYGNVLNEGLIDNLPAAGCVEVPVLVDGTGLHPIHFGPLPAQMAALNAAHMYMHELMAQAVLERRREAALQALLLDPLTAAVLSPAEIRSLFDEMWAAQQADLRAFD